MLLSTLPFVDDFMFVPRCLQMPLSESLPLFTSVFSGVFPALSFCLPTMLLHSASFSQILYLHEQLWPPWAPAFWSQSLTLGGT